MTGNALANVITGDATNNIINTGTGAAADSLYGGAGNDTYYVHNAGDYIYEYNASDGVDTVVADVSYTLNGWYVDNLVLAEGAGDINGTGQYWNNIITGNSGKNTLDGGALNDVLIGGGGADVLIGGADTDTASYENASAGVKASLLTPSSNTGDAAGDTYTSIEKPDRIRFQRHPRRRRQLQLHHFMGRHRRHEGGAGNDTYAIGALDTVTELGGEGTDVVYFYGGGTGTSYTLAANVENMFLASGAISGTGNSGVNTITGNSGDNVLDGGGTDGVVDNPHRR